MLEIRYENPKTLEVVSIEPFAWFHWPMEFLNYATQTLRDATLTATNKKYLAMRTLTIKRATYHYEGNELTARPEMDITGILTPIRSVMKFETEQDFLRFMSTEPPSP